MRMITPMLFACTLVALGCATGTPPSPSTEPSSSSTSGVSGACAMPSGSYTLYGLITEVTPSEECPRPDVAVGASTTMSIQIDASGRVVSSYAGLGMECSTSYSDEGCALRATCVGTRPGMSFSEELSYRVSTDGRTLSGRYVLAGCPRIVVEGVAQKPAQ